MKYPAGSNDERGRSREPRVEIWSGDLKAMDAVSKRGIPEMTDTSRALHKALEKRYRGGPLMNSIRNMKSRPWLATSVGAAVVAATLLFVPISYERTVGHDLVLGLQSDSMTENSAMEITDEVARLFHAEQISVRPASGVDYAVHARISDQSRGELELLVAAYTAQLAGRGIETSTNITSIVERVASNVYAAAANSLGSITIRTKGMSADEIAEDIRSQMEAAGIYGPEIEVDKDGDDCRVFVRVEDEGEGGLPEILCDDELDGGRARIEIRRTPEMTDTDIITEVERQLSEQGIDANVSIGIDGKIRIDMD